MFTLLFANLENEVKTQKILVKDNIDANVIANSFILKWPDFKTFSFCIGSIVANLARGSAISWCCI